MHVTYNCEHETKYSHMIYELKTLTRTDKNAHKHTHLHVSRKRKVQYIKGKSHILFMPLKCPLTFSILAQRPGQKLSWLFTFHQIVLLFIMLFFNAWLPTACTVTDNRIVRCSYAASAMIWFNLVGTTAVTRRQLISTVWAPVMLCHVRNQSDCYKTHSMLHLPWRQ